jgi:transcriptional regulator with XRE-family HTH domain
MIVMRLPTFAENIGSYMKAIGLNQAELARRIGVGSPTLTRYVKGERLPPGPLLVALSEVLGVAPKALLGSNAIELPEVGDPPRVGRPPKATKDELAASMLAELRSPAPPGRPAQVEVTPTPSRRTKRELE